MDEIKHLTTVAEVIDHLGGQAALGRAMGGFSRVRVHNWKITNRFPPETYVAMRHLLARSGAIAPNHLWAMHPIPGGDDA